MIKFVVIPNSQGNVKCKEKTIIILNCPRCGQIGILNRNGRRATGNRYVIKHQFGSCTFGPCSHEDWDELDRIYRSVKMQ